MAEVDLVNRDPNNINNHLQCAFEDVLAEPDDIHSIDCVWKLSYTCFNCWKRLCYVIATTCCGICIAASWGCEFANTAFCHIWYFTPCFKLCDLNCGCMRKCYGMCINCWLEPLCSACGEVFRHFKR